MTPTRAARSGIAHQARGLLLRRVSYGEADLVLSVLSDTLGRISLLARAARRSQKRFGGALEPMHTLALSFDERPNAELFQLREAALARPRMHLASSLERLDCAGRALGWVRKAAPPRTPEPLVFSTLEALLDRLDDPAENAEPARVLAASGLRLLVAFGWGIDFTRCVRCGKPAPPERAASVDPVHGGLVCAACGGASTKLSAAQRSALARAAAGELAALSNGDARLALALIDRVLVSHAGFE